MKHTPRKSHTYTFDSMMMFFVLMGPLSRSAADNTSIAHQIKAIEDESNFLLAAAIWPEESLGLLIALD